MLTMGQFSKVLLGIDKVHVHGTTEGSGLRTRLWLYCK